MSIKYVMFTLARCPDLRASDFSIAFPPGVSAPVPVAELEAQVERLREAIAGALRIKKLWAPTGPWPDDHTGEAEALAIMENNFSQALAETEETL